MKYCRTSLFHHSISPLVSIPSRNTKRMEVGSWSEEKIWTLVEVRNLEVRSIGKMTGMRGVSDPREIPEVLKVFLYCKQQKRKSTETAETHRLIDDQSYSISESSPQRIRSAKAMCDRRERTLASISGSLHLDS